MEIVIVFGLSMGSILYKPACLSNSVLYTLNCFQSLWEVSNLLKNFLNLLIFWILLLGA